MTALPPPQQTRQGLHAFLDDRNRLGEELRKSWRDTEDEVDEPDPDVLPRNKQEAGAARYEDVLAELISALSASRNEKQIWSVLAETTVLTTLSEAEPRHAQVIEAILRLPGTPPANLNGILGQRDWVAVYFAKALDLHPVDHDQVLDLLDAAVSATMMPVFAIKNVAKIPRPWQVVPGISPHIGLLWHSSYPSGHAAAAHVCAELLVKMLDAGPVRASRLRKLAYIISKNRERALVHTDLDTKAGREIGEGVATWLVEQGSGTTRPAWAALFQKALRQLR
jgi:hypothetical protein